MDAPLLWYFADPMCSWCWGFAPTIEAIRDAYAGRLRIALVPGGLRVGATTPMTATMREEILHHWRAVAARTGQPFDFEHALPEGFVYDTEPACRALVAFGKLAPDRVFAYMKATQHAFYAEARDITQDVELARLARALGVDDTAFLDTLAADATRAATRAQFVRARDAGVRAFPTLILQHAGAQQVVCNGCLPLAAVNAALDTALAAA